MRLRRGRCNLCGAIAALSTRAIFSTSTSASSPEVRAILMSARASRQVTAISLTDGYMSAPARVLYTISTGRVLTRAIITTKADMSYPFSPKCGWMPNGIGSHRIFRPRSAGMSPNVAAFIFRRQSVIASTGDESLQSI